MKKVLITGTFDILHPGHLNFIKQAMDLGDCLVIVVARDKNVAKAKGREPYFDEERRLDNLTQNFRPKAEWARAGKLKTQNYNFKVVLGDLNNPYKVIDEERPDIIALGYDQRTFVDGLNQLKTQDPRPKIVRLQPFKEDICKGKSIRKAVEDEKAGFLLINKEENWTSHDVVAKLRNITAIRQIGHTGTLDPFATGLLICAIGQATKMVGLFDLLLKIYEAEIRLGVESDTYDRTGKLKTQNSKLKTDLNQLKDILESFVGKQRQLPPMYSAKKVQGRKLYELARRGEEVERQPSNIEIYDIELLEYKTKNFLPKPNQPGAGRLKAKIKCSTGTYIRTLAHDIGQKLGTGAVLWELKRTAIGDFKLNEAVQLEQLSKDYSKYLIKPLEAINRVNEFYVQSVLK